MCAEFENFLAAVVAVVNSTAKQIGVSRACSRFRGVYPRNLRASISCQSCSSRRKHLFMGLCQRRLRIVVPNVEQTVNGRLARDPRQVHFPSNVWGSRKLES